MLSSAFVQRPLKTNTVLQSCLVECWFFVPSLQAALSTKTLFRCPPVTPARIQTNICIQHNHILMPMFTTGECLTSLLMVQAVAVIVIVIVKRVHDDSVFKTRPPPRWLYMTMHYLKYPFLLWHIEFRPADYQCITRSLFAKNGSLKNQVGD